jgi:NADH dehydrogenase
VAIQEGQAIGRNISLDIMGLPRKPFNYHDKGQMATIGKNASIAERGNVRLSGLPAWLIWLAVHIYYLSRIKHRLFVNLQWAWAYFTFGHGARIVNKERRFYANLPESAEPEPLVRDPLCVNKPAVQMFTCVPFRNTRIAGFSRKATNFRILA